MDHSPVREHLRAVTADIHERLHQAQSFAAIASGALMHESYGKVLAMLHRYHHGMAQVCANGAQALGVTCLAEAHQARIAALEEDLAFLGVTPRPLEQPVEGAGAFAMGCLYTVQGSTLGGKVIHRQLDYLLPDDKGRRFFKGGREDGKLWAGLCAALERQSVSPGLEKGALYAFARFQELLP